MVDHMNIQQKLANAPFEHRRRDVEKVKVITVGDMAVGKSCLTMRFVNDTFEKKHNATVGAIFVAKAVETGDKTMIFQVWDTAGQERFHCLIPMYARDAKAAIAVYDITDSESFQNIKKHWMQVLDKHSPRNIHVALVGNKADLDEERTVTTMEAQRFASDHNLMFMETSAKTGENVEKLFCEIAKRIGESAGDDGDDDSEDDDDDDDAEKRARNGSNVQLSESSRKTSKKNCCGKS